MPNDEKLLLEQIKEYRNDMVARNYPHQQISNIITCWLFFSIVSVKLIIYLIDPKVAARIDTTIGTIIISLLFCKSIGLL